MRKVLAMICVVALPSVIFALILLELVFRFVIPACQIPDLVWDGDARLPKGDVRGPREGTYTIGRFAHIRARWQINNEGWNSEIDYFPRPSPSAGKPLVALIGDSYIDGICTDVDKGVAADLRRFLGPGVDVFSFGISGVPLSQYLHISRHVVKRYHPNLLVFSVVHNDFLDSIADLVPLPNYLQLTRTADSFTERQPVPYEPSRFKRVLKKSAVARYFSENLKVRGNSVGEFFGFHALRNVNANIDVDRAVQNRQLIEGATHFLVSRVRAENPDTAILFMMDCPRDDMYGGRLRTSSVLWMTVLLEADCRKNNIEFLDLCEPFSKSYASHKMTFDYSPYDGHWNPRGNLVVSESLAHKIQAIGWPAGAK